MMTTARLALLIVSLAACGSKKDAPAAGSGRAEKLPEAERQRGADACSQYLTALCACAARKPDDANLADRCHMKQAKPEALALLLAVDDDPASSDDSRLRAQIEARKLIAKCVMEHASLPSLGCNQ
jgi:hypothetical protein